MTDPDAIKAARRQLSRLPADHPEVKHAHEMLDRATTELAQGDIRFACELIFKAGMSAAIATVSPIVEELDSLRSDRSQEALTRAQSQYAKLRFHLMLEGNRLRSEGVSFNDAADLLFSKQRAIAEREGIEYQPEKPLTARTIKTIKDWLKSVYPEAERPKRGRPKKK